MVFLRLVILWFVCVVSFNEIISQPKYISQQIDGIDLPFREVIASFEFDSGMIWMVLPSHICRNNGHEVECFPIDIQGVEGAFVAEDRYIIIHNWTRNTTAYFDTEKYAFDVFPWTNEYSLIYHQSSLNRLITTNDNFLFYFDFKNKSLVPMDKKSPFANAPMNAKFITGDGNFVQFLEKSILVNGENSNLKPCENLEFGQALSTKDGLLISNGISIYFRPKNQNIFQEIYTDDLFCKKIFVDESNHILMNLHKQNICKYSEKILLLDVLSKRHEDWSALIPSHFDSTLAHIGGIDFTKKTLVSSYHGFEIKVSTPMGIQKLLTVKKTSGFGRIIKGITSDQDGNIWCSGELRNLYKIKDNSMFDSFPIPLKVYDTTMMLTFSRNLVLDTANHLLWNTSGSYIKDETVLYGWDMAQQKVVYTMPIPHRIWSFISYQNSLLLTSNREIAFKFNIENKKLDTLVVLHKDSLPQLRVLYLDDPILYMGGKRGLYSYHLKTKQIDKISFFDDKQIYSIIKSETNLYIGTLEGLWIYNIQTKRFTHFNVDNGLSNNFVTGCQIINNNRILVFTYDGINLIDLKYMLITKYFEKDGISDNECNFISSYSDDKDIYTGTINGITQFNIPFFRKENGCKPRIYKTLADGFNREIVVNRGTISNLTFLPSIQSLKIFLEADQKGVGVRYAYRYSNVDTSWVPLEGHTLEILRPETSRNSLEIKCTDEHGIWSNTYERFELTVQNYWYKSPLFYMIFAGLFSVFLFNIIVREQKKKKDNDLKIAVLNQQATENKLAALQAQMNPHFLFNAISSIQYFINRNEMQEADDYLSKFSSLIRKILENSRKKTISLAEEIDMLRLYTNIEEKRFNNKFTTFFKIEEGIEEEFIQIPSMMIQPLIENAINHGLMHLIDRDGKLLITISEIENELIIKVIDNGVGIANNSLQTNKSLALSIIQDRIKAYERSGEFAIHFSLYKNDQAFGTTSELRIKSLP